MKGLGQFDDGRFQFSTGPDSAGDFVAEIVESVETSCADRGLDKQESRSEDGRTVTNGHRTINVGRGDETHEVKGKRTRTGHNAEVRTSQAVRPDLFPPRASIIIVAYLEHAEPTGLTRFACPATVGPFLRCSS
jgi:hypothetical protein